MKLATPLCARGVLHLAESRRPAQHCLVRASNPVEFQPLAYCLLRRQRAWSERIWLASPATRTILWGRCPALKMSRILLFPLFSTAVQVSAWSLVCGPTFRLWPVWIR